VQQALQHRLFQDALLGLLHRLSQQFLDDPLLLLNLLHLQHYVLLGNVGEQGK
jgi:hypothetical protein